MDALLDENLTGSIDKLATVDWTVMLYALGIFALFAGGFLVMRRMLLRGTPSLGSQRALWFVELIGLPVLIFGARELLLRSALARGSTEMAGVSGATGATGATGAQGATGLTGAEGRMAEGGSWSVYRDYTFQDHNDQILHSDSNKARELAQYMNQNPSYRAGIDGANETRVNNVRDAMINAGIPADKIRVGAFGDPQFR